MTTEKRSRTEDTVDAAEPPLKKSKSKSKKDKLKSENEESSTTATPTGTSTPSELSKKEKKDKKRNKKKERKEKSKTSSAVDSPAAEEQQNAAADTTDAPEETNVPEPEALSKAERKKLKKAKKNKNKNKSEAKPTDDISSTDSIYEEAKSLQSLPESDITTFLSTHSITVTNPPKSQSYRPITAFSHLPATTLTSKKPFAAFKEPTPIQAASWPYGLAGRDIIGIAETGSGKTMAFALPCVEAILADVAKTGNAPQNLKKTRAVIVSPTRELAMQTDEQVSKLCSLVGLNSVCIYGGASKEMQRSQLRKGAAVIVATPGRLKDFLDDGGIALDSAAFVVLDEADRMLDTGFEEDIKLILGKCPPKDKRQTVMFTATWPTTVQTLAHTFMVSPVKITIGRGNNGDGKDGDEFKLQANNRIKQEVEVIEQYAKEQRGLQIIKQHQAGSKKDNRILVFCLYKKEASRVEQFLEQRGINVCCIQGDMKQEKRTASLNAFKSGEKSVLVATDVAARGLDIPEVKLVLNLTFPLTIEDYVHRIGRTGRAGKQGHAITLFTELDKSHSGELVNVLKGANQPVPDELLKFGTTVKKKAHDSYGAFYKNVDMTKKASKITFD